ncbi:MAG TPA: lamin tail domain-containing protein, partial [Methylomirabilota bacterium]|nr:lamin tail domain-containing protein [Methylomirabilota bacterium]
MRILGPVKTFVRWFLLFALLWALPRLTFAAETVFISEFLASNNGGLTDEDGDTSDWIEIFNSGTNTVNMNGWFLTDSAANLTKWRIPAISLV